MIKLIKGDLFQTDAEIIAHGVNCRGGFGSGIAGIIAKEYPWVRDAYIKKHTTDGWRLGEVQFVYPPNGGTILPIIANIATQRSFGYDGKKYVTYTAIDKGMRNVARYAKDLQYTIALPKIGSDRGGGDWNKILSILSKIAIDYPSVNFEVYYL